MEEALLYIMKARQNKRGFTLVELLIVISLLAILVLAVLLTNWKAQIARGHDARRKADLYALRTAFEDYYNDKNCYPPADTLTHCAGDQLQPYLTSIPCDPETKLPYRYIPIDSNDLCKGYRILTTLSDTSDRDITAIGCSAEEGCGFGVTYNWGVSSGIQIPATAATASGPSGAVGTPSPTSGAGHFVYYACAPSGICNAYANPWANGCPTYFYDQLCSNQCGDQAVWCAK